MTNKNNHIVQFEELPVPVLINWLSFAACGLLTLFAIRHWLAHQPVIALSLGGFMVLLAINALWYRWRQQLTFYRWCFIGLIFSLFVYLVISGVEQGNGILWLFAFPPLVFYISSLRLGAFLSFGGLALLILVLLGFDGTLTQHGYSRDFRIMFLFSFAFEVVFCFVLDLSRRKSKNHLLHLVRDLDFAASHDGLTGLFNRREATRQLTAEYERFLRSGHAFAIMLIDVDHFKHINDTYGHDSGDQVLRQISTILQQTCRKTDRVGRWGGEEFLVMFPDTGLPEAGVIASRIRENIEQHHFLVGANDVAVTISAGLVDSVNNLSLEDLLRDVDELLYEAKHQGRNRLCCRGLPDYGAPGAVDAVGI